MRARTVAVAAVAMFLPLLTAGCAPPAGSTAAEVSPFASAQPPLPQLPFPVGVRTLHLARGADRPLPTTIWYPARRSSTPGPDAPIARTRFPVVLLSHGLRASPAHFAELASQWATDGFVVVAPTYPHTSEHAERFDRSDIVNQPADAAYVLDQVLALDTTVDDPFAGRIGAQAVAVGHSAGGYTTTGLFTRDRPEQLRGGVVIAGWGVPEEFGQDDTPLLFVHGTADPVVPASAARLAYDRVLAPKAFLALPGYDHGAYLKPDDPAYQRTLGAITDFLRWRLRGDQAAYERLRTRADAGLLESRLTS